MTVKAPASEPAKHSRAPAGATFVRAHMHSSQRIVIASWLIALTVFCGAPREVPGGAPRSLKSVEQIGDLQRLFQNPPDDSRIMMRWWWFGPAITEAELEREMRLMKQVGIGGFEVQPVVQSPGRSCWCFLRLRFNRRARVYQPGCKGSKVSC